VALTFNLTGAQSTYRLEKITLGVAQLQQSGLDIKTIRVGFGLSSESGSFDSSWWLDDVRVDGSDWGTMSSVGLAQPGDAIDEAYVMMGGTSMATPLTSGAAALTREWLTRVRGWRTPAVR